MSLPVFDRSPLDTVDPHGRADVLASNLIRRALSGNMIAAAAYESIRPVSDFLLLYLLGPEAEFDKAMRGHKLQGPRTGKNRKLGVTAARTRKVKPPGRNRSRGKVHVIDAEVVAS